MRDKNVIIIGATSGIGEGLAELYYKEGARLYLSGRRVERLEEFARGRGEGIRYYKMDVADSNLLEVFSKMVEDCIGGVDLVIYCAGFGKQNRELDYAIEKNSIDVNVTGFTTIAGAVYSYAKENLNGDRGLQFVVISSIASVKGLGVAASYSATKMYQVKYMEALAQLSKIDRVPIQFTTIKPGFIDTDFIKGGSYPMVMKKEYALSLIKRAIDRRCSSPIIDWKWSVVVFFWKLIPSWLWKLLPITS